jgi:hypothetical protein
MGGVGARLSLLTPVGLPLQAAIRLLAVSSQAAVIALRAGAHGRAGVADSGVGCAADGGGDGAGSSAGGCGGGGRRRGGGGRQPVREVRAVLQRGAHRQHLRQRDRQPRAAHLRARARGLCERPQASWKSLIRGSRQAWIATLQHTPHTAWLRQCFSCISKC